MTNSNDFRLNVHIEDEIKGMKNVSELENSKICRMDSLMSRIRINLKLIQSVIWFLTTQAVHMSASKIDWV